MVSNLCVGLGNPYELMQGFPTCGPRVKSGPPSLKKWPSASQRIKRKIYIKNCKSWHFYRIYVYCIIITICYCKLYYFDIYKLHQTYCFGSILNNFIYFYTILIYKNYT